jgi:hypothetical protein
LICPFLDWALLIMHININKGNRLYLLMAMGLVILQVKDATLIFSF